MKTRKKATHIDSKEKKMKHNGYQKDHKRLNKFIDFMFSSLLFSTQRFMILDVALGVTIKKLFFNDFLVHGSFIT